MVHAEVHAPMEPPEPEVQTEAQIPDEALDQVRHPPAPKDPADETEVPELLVTYSTSTTKTNGSRATITSSFTYAQTNAIV